MSLDNFSSKISRTTSLCDSIIWFHEIIIYVYSCIRIYVFMHLIYVAFIWQVLFISCKGPMISCFLVLHAHIRHVHQYSTFISRYACMPIFNLLSFIFRNLNILSPHIQLLIIDKIKSSNRRLKLTYETDSSRPKSRSTHMFFFFFLFD